MRTIEDRVRELERSALRWRMLATSLTLLVFAAFISGQTTREAKTLDAERITFRDSKGKPRMELRRQNDQKSGEQCGIYFMDESGEAIGSLAQERESLQLQINQSEKSRRTAALAFVETMNLFRRSPDAKKADLERANGLGKLVVEVNNLGVSVYDFGPGAWHNLGPDGLATNSVLVAPHGALTVGGTRTPGTISILDGSVRVRSTKDEREAILGRINVTETRSGGALELPVSSLTLFNETGKVSFRAP